MAGFDAAAWIVQNFRTAPGQQLTVKQSTGVVVARGGSKPVPAPTGEPREFIVSGSRQTGIVKSSDGTPCASIDITQLESAVKARLNERIDLPFAHVAFRALECGNASENGVHRLTIPTASRGMRNLAFLGPDDELVIVVPIDTLALECPVGREVSATVKAMVWWRSRLDGTSG